MGFGFSNEKTECASSVYFKEFIKIKGNKQKIQK